MKKDPVILLTFDVEEFDLPLEYKLSIEPEEQMQIGKKGLDVIENMLEEQNIETTLFTTANFAQQYPESIAGLSMRNEIASHAFYHSSFEKADLLGSRLVLEGICNKKVEGLRMPRLKKIDMEWVKEAGYRYDSSINPTYIPGRYDNRRLPRTVYREDDMVRLPTSVTPNLRLPLFWLSFKNLPYKIYKKMALKTLQHDGYLSLYFHPWEFTDINSWNLPGYIKRSSGQILTERLVRLVTDLKKEGEFLTVSGYLRKQGFIT